MSMTSSPRWKASRFLGQFVDLFPRGYGSAQLGLSRVRRKPIGGQGVTDERQVCQREDVGITECGASGCDRTSGRPGAP